MTDQASQVPARDAESVRPNLREAECCGTCLQGKYLPLVRSVRCRADGSSRPTMQRPEQVCDAYARRGEKSHGE